MRNSFAPNTTPICPYCGDPIEKRPMGRRRATWHPGCWLDLSILQRRIRQFREVLVIE
jgi:hypothetical protein